VDLDVRDEAYVVGGGTAGMGLAGAKVLAVDGAAVPKTPPRHSRLSAHRPLTV
jgi:hypothetical protein